MRKSLFLALILSGCATVPTGAVEAATYKRCPDGSQVRRTRSCPTIPSFSVSDATFSEGVGTGTITITKSGSNGKSSAINYMTNDGTAIAGSDYLAHSGSLTFGPTQTTATFSVSLIDDTLVETAETFGVHLSVNSNAVIARNGTMTITDNDVPAAPLPPPSTQMCHDGSVIPTTNTCPAIPPPPTTQTCPDGSVIPVASVCPVLPAPTPTLGGLASIASNFDTTLGVQPSWGTGAIPDSAGSDPNGAFRFICGPGQVLADDPVVFPGQPGRSHLHQFYGNTGANAFSTYSSLRTSGGSTCNHYGDVSTALNRSAYWMPAMLNGLGQVVRPDYVVIYYKRRPASDPVVSDPTNPAYEGQAVPLPRGLRFIYGFNMLNPSQTPTGNFWWDCTGPTATPGTYPSLTAALANCPAGNRVGTRLEAPECWNGKDLDSLDHRGHVSYPQQDGYGHLKCPTGFPYVIPTFTLAAWFSILPGENTSLWSLSSDAMFPNLAKGTTIHADWFGAWDDPTMLSWTNTGCIGARLNCSGGDMGTGKQLRGAASGGDATPRLVPIP